MHNERAKSVVYFVRSSAKLCVFEFTTVIYLSNQNLHISGNVEFDGNIAENGAGRNFNQ